MTLLPKLSSLTLPWSTDWTAIFGRGAPLILEIGFGYGAFLVHLARTNPDANVMGIEIANRCLNATEQAVIKENFTNVRLVYSLAETALHHLFEPQTIDQIHINFPDPWFKRGHSQRRLMQRNTLDVMVNRLKPDGKLYLATDIREYAEMSAELLAETPTLTNLLPSAWVYKRPERGIVTKYEGIAKHEGRPCHYFVYQRNNVTAPAVHVIKELEMPHIIFQSPLSFDEMFSRFNEAKIVDSSTATGTYLSFMDAYLGESSLMFEVFVKEPTIEQHFAMRVVNREQQGEYTLKLSTLGHPRATSGIHLAVGTLGSWLANLHPEAKILSSKIQLDAAQISNQTPSET